MNSTLDALEAEVQAMCAKRTASNSSLDQLSMDVQQPQDAAFADYLRSVRAENYKLQAKLRGLELEDDPFSQGTTNEWKLGPLEEFAKAVTPMVRGPKAANYYTPYDSDDEEVLPVMRRKDSVQRSWSTAMGEEASGLVTPSARSLPPPAINTHDLAAPTNESPAHPASPLSRKLGVEVDSLQVENPDVIRDMMRTISVAHVARTWQQKARRRLRINKNDVSQYQDVEIPFNPLPKDMHMMLWTAFQSNYMLGNMEEQVAKRMLNSMQMMEFGPGDVLLEQGALSRNMFILVKGLVEAYMRPLGSKIESLVWKRGAGQAFCESCLLTMERSQMTLRAKTSTTAYALSHDVFNAIVQQETQFKERCMFLREVKLDGAYLFENMDDVELQLVATKFKEMCYRKGTKIVKQGDVGKDWYIILEGSVDIQKDGVSVRHLARGMWFGESAAVTGNAVRNADCVATIKSDLLVLSGADCEEVFQKLPFAHTYNNRLMHAAVTKIPIPILQSMEATDIENIQLKYTKMEFAPGEYIVRQNALADSYLVITKGEVLVVHTTPPQQQGFDQLGQPVMAPPQTQVVGNLSQSDSLGARGLFFGEPFQCSAVAGPNGAQCTSVSKEQFTALLQLVVRRQWAETLRGWPLFATMKQNDLNGIKDHLNLAVYNQSQPIVQQGAMDNRFFMVKSGEALAMKRMPTGEVKVMMRLNAGAFFGESCILNGEPYEFTVMAASQEPVECFWVQGNLLETKMANLSVLLWEHMAWLKAGNKHVDSPIEERLKDQNLKLSDFNMHRMLGKGQFGRVLLVSSKLTGRKYALKILSKAMVVEEGQVEHVKLEKEVLAKLDHPFCNKLVKTFHDDKRLFMLITLCLGGDLLRLQEQYPKSRIPNDAAKFYIAQIVCAIEYIHSLDVAYRDLKQENILIDANGYLKIVDYGLSKFVPKNQRAFTMCGTAQFLAPEVITRRGHGKEVDFWSLGVLMYEIMTGKNPFIPDETPDELEEDDDDDDEDKEEVFKYILAGKYKIPSYMSKDAANLLMALMQRDPGARLGAGPDGFKKLKSHPWFATIDWNKLMRKQLEPPYKPQINDPLDTQNFEDYQLDFSSGRLSTVESADNLRNGESPVANVSIDPATEALLNQYF
eukprot:CAMPEP_0114327148 /NCGR_PEP_ID=MMETSP0059-20121206/30140_1 /TAXON_ID=36894 /ORGANISM="Pyramimonas parkeae, Strain CCMP726" /LENGTH=1129 /DNA_ID=CAMNT_0001456243 /DNA_START=206 /DNA_END=3595 /DNA_ORIENTATION=-